MNKIARTLSTLTTAAVLAISSSPALAVNTNQVSLVQRADGSLAITTQHSHLDKLLSNDKVLATTTDEVATFIEPIQDDDLGGPLAGIATQAHDAKDPNRSSQWGLTQLDIEPAWSHTKGEGVTVAVIDTGIDITHPDFEGRVTRGYTAPGQNQGDFNGHGTHVAGIIGAGDNNQIAGTGVAPDVKLWEAKVTQDSGIGNSTWMAEGIVAAINANVDVINISMTANAPMPLVEAAISQAVARNIPVFAAAGNEGLKGSPTRWPAAYSNTIAVGSITRSLTRSGFSNVNDYVDLTAPGSAINSLLPGGGMGMMSGTSQATPHAAGVAALVKALKPSTSANAMRDLLVNNTDGELKTLNAHKSLGALGFQKTAPVLLAPSPNNPKPNNREHTNAPKPNNPVRHFIRPER